jgi:hypothetical protein
MIRKNTVLLVSILSSILLLSFGCSEREESTVAPGSTLKADIALKEAEAKLEAAGVSLSFDEPGELVHPEDLLPDPVDLSDLEKQSNFEQAIEQLNIVLAEIEREVDAAPLGSISDRALVHLHLGFSYLFEAVSRLLISDDPEETFIMERNPGAASGGLYTFGISPITQAKLDATEDSLDYPLAFTVKERQAIIDAADLIDDAIVKPKAPDIQPQFSSVDRPPYTGGSTVWHFEKACSLFGEYGSDEQIKEALEDFNERLEELRSKLQEKSESWGFIYTRPPGR